MDKANDLVTVEPDTATKVQVARVPDTVTEVQIARVPDTATEVRVISPTPLRDSTPQPLPEKHKRSSVKIETIGKKMKKNFREELLERTTKYSSTRPSGIFAIHIKTAELHSIELEGDFTVDDNISVFIRIQCINQMKYTKTHGNVVSPMTVRFDEVKHFDFTVDRLKQDPFYFSMFDLVAFGSHDVEKQKIVASREINLLEIIKNLHSINRISMWSHNHQVALLDVEFCFAYGIFGYGYSNLFENPSKPSKIQLGKSMFCRQQPSTNRVDPLNNHVATAIPVPKPPIVTFTCSVAFNSTGNELKEQPQPISTLWRTNAAIGKSLAALQMAYSDLKTRRERILFLQKLVINPRNDDPVEPDGVDSITSMEDHLDCTDCASVFESPTNELPTDNQTQMTIFRRIRNAIYNRCFGTQQSKVAPR